MNNNPTDLVYAGAQPWHPSTLDVTKTKYYRGAAAHAARSSKCPPNRPAGRTR